MDAVLAPHARRARCFKCGLNRVVRDFPTVLMGPRSCSEFLMYVLLSDTLCGAWTAPPRRAFCVEVFEIDFCTTHCYIAAASTEVGVPYVCTPYPSTGHHALDRCAQHVCFCLTKLLTVRTGGATCTQTIAHHAVHLVQHRRPITAIVLQRLETDPSRRVGFVCQFVWLQTFVLPTRGARRLISEFGLRMGISSCFPSLFPRAHCSILAGIQEFLTASPDWSAQFSARAQTSSSAYRYKPDVDFSY